MLGPMRVLATFVALAMSTGTACAAMGKTTTDVALRSAPSAKAELIVNLSQGTLVGVGSCSHGWCGVSWNRYGGYVRESALQFQSTPASGPPGIPVYPNFPYKAGHYPTADAYYDLPPYAAIDPSFYRWRHFLMAQERNRYRYMPHIFHGYTGYREDTVGRYVSSSLSKPMSAETPSVEPTPATPAPSPQTPATVNELRDVTVGLSVKRSILGQTIYNEKNERVGSVDDIVVTRDKSVAYAIVNAGGFLRMTKHNVAIPVSKFKLVDNKVVLPGATKEALKAMPEFQYAH